MAARWGMLHLLAVMLAGCQPTGRTSSDCRMAGRLSGRCRPQARCHRRSRWSIVFR